MGVVRMRRDGYKKIFSRRGAVPGLRMYSILGSIKGSFEGCSDQSEISQVG